MTNVAISLPDDLKLRAEELARERGISIDEVVRQALANEMEPLEQIEIVDGRPVITPALARRMKCPFPRPEPDLCA